MSLGAERFRKDEPGVKVTVGIVGNRRRVRALLPRRDRRVERLAADRGGRGGALRQERRSTSSAPGRERRDLDRRQQGQRLGDLPDRRPAQEDLGAGLEGRQLARPRSHVPRRRAQALRRRHGLGHLRLLHRARSSARKARAAATTRRARTTTSPCAASPATRARSGTSASPTTRRTATRLKAVEIDGGDGCVAPSVETVQDGSYKPLSRPLFSLRQRGRDRREAGTRPVPPLRPRQRGEDREGRAVRADDARADRRGEDRARERRGRGRGMRGGFGGISLVARVRCFVPRQGRRERPYQ